MTAIRCAIATDFCRPDLCPEGTSNIACNNDGVSRSKQFPTQSVDYRSFYTIGVFLQSFLPTCVSPQGVYLTDKQKKMVLRLHNQMRSDIACGKIPGYGKASRMGEMVSSGITSCPSTSIRILFAYLLSFGIMNWKKCHRIMQNGVHLLMTIAEIRVCLVRF